MARLVLENLSKTFHDSNRNEIVAVRGLHLEVRDGEFLVLVGPSGSGKTTLLRLIAGLENPDSGAVRLNDQPMDGVHPKDRDVALVFQNFALYPHLSVRENLAFGLKIRHAPAEERNTRVNHAASTLGIHHLLDRRPDQLSGGERQRVALGRALVRQPGAFLLDEPLSNLDPRLRLRLRLELARLHRQLRSTMLYVTHDQTEAMTLGDRIAVMHQGAIEQVAEPLTLYRRPINEFVASFIGSPPINLFPGTLDNPQGRWTFIAHDRSAPFHLELPHEWRPEPHCAPGQPVRLGLRPEAFTLLPTPPATPSPALLATVELVETLGSETIVHLAAAADLPFSVRTPAGFHTAPGDRWLAQPDPRQAHLFNAHTGRSISHAADPTPLHPS